jgi:hypothetical protein
MSERIREIEATDFRNGTITTTLQQFDYLITERAVIKQQAADIY